MIELPEQVTIDPVAGWPNTAGHVVAQLYINSLLVTLNARKNLRKAHGLTVEHSEIVTIPVAHGNHVRLSDRQSVVQSDFMEIESSKAASFTEVGTHSRIIDISFDEGRRGRDANGDIC
ncbi:hypothetical protein EIP86_011041 [Pleurotus ostreatoroseus]|nr:hypothetical protein EIP86_011041 [Pleurotus ostreatoroseus]